MPFKSEAQRRYFYAVKPDMAKEFEKETPKSKLPEKLGDQSAESTRAKTEKTEKDKKSKSKKKDKSIKIRLVKKLDEKKESDLLKLNNQSVVIQEAYGKKLLSLLGKARRSQYRPKNFIRDFGTGMKRSGQQQYWGSTTTKGVKSGIRKTKIGGALQSHAGKIELGGAAGLGGAALLARRRKKKRNQESALQEARLDTAKRVLKAIGDRAKKTPKFMIKHPKATLTGTTALGGYGALRYRRKYKNSQRENKQLRAYLGDE